MRVVLDTNVFISGVFFTGPPYKILEAWRDARIQLVVSPAILEEYKRVGETLATQFPGVDLEPILDFLTLHAEVVTADTLLEPVCRDPDDDKFVACALASGVRHVISGDKHLLNASGYKGLKVVSPRRFVDDYL